ncbi:MAG: GTPase HflX [Crenarchaeota archaeon]|nr:GTPase HflX [Thermoproteota archaeon]
MGSDRVLLICRDPIDVDEATALLNEAGYRVAKTLIVKHVKNPCYLGRGKLSEVKDIVKKLDVKKVFVFDELKPRHVTCLMKELRTEIIDKVLLILEIFDLHAGSKEAKLQIELARLKHQLPLIRDWLRRAKLRELPGFLGAGEYVVSAYYRHVRKRIARISRELEILRKRREIERSKRREYGIPHIAIAGYTNSGKTTLFNALTNLRKPTGTELFTTMNPKTYAVKICGARVAFVDTVGFIRKIPLEIIEAFRAVLEEITFSDAVMLTLDVSEPDELVLEKLDSSIRILRSIGAVGVPVVVVLNKIDLVPNPDRIGSMITKVSGYLRSTELNVVDIVPVSALKRINFDSLKDAICRAASVLNSSRHRMSTCLG